MAIFGYPSVMVFLTVAQVFLLTPTGSTQTVTDCFRRVPEGFRGAVCDIRKYRVASGEETDRYISCALGALGFVGGDGSIQRNVLLSALEEVESHDGVYTDSVDACLSRTRRQTTTVAAERPRAFFCCMLATESAQNFKDALELQELKAVGQWPEGDAFDRAKVQRLMAEVNRSVQCK